MKRLFFYQKNSGVPRSIGKVILFVFAFSLGERPFLSLAKVQFLPKIQQNWERRINTTEKLPTKIQPASCEERNMLSAVPPLANCKIWQGIGGQKCYRDCTCPSGYAFVGKTCEVSCSSDYAYSCSGTGYTGGAGSPCKGKYTSCVCGVGYSWSGSSCTPCSADYSKTEAVCKSEHAGFANWTVDAGKMCSNKSRSCVCTPGQNCPAAIWNLTSEATCLYGADTCNDGCQLRYKCRSCVGNPPAGYSSVSPVCGVNQSMLISDDGCGKDYYKCVCSPGYIDEEKYWNGL